MCSVASTGAFELTGALFGTFNGILLGIPSGRFDATGAALVGVGVGVELDLLWLHNNVPVTPTPIAQRMVMAGITLLLRFELMISFLG